MMSPNENAVSNSIVLELESTRAAFQVLLDSLSEDDFRRQSLNPGGTNGEILAQSVFGFFIMNVL